MGCKHGYLNTTALHILVRSLHTAERFSNTSPGLQAEPLELTSGVIWTALNIDYPGHSFSHLGIFFGERIHILIESTRTLHDV